MSRQASGLRAWFIQRVTAVYLSGYLLYFFFRLIAQGSFSANQWHNWFATPVMSLATGLFFWALLLHAWVGIRDVILDYVHPVGMRIVLLSVVVLILAGCGIWVLRLLLLHGAG